MTGDDDIRPRPGRIGNRIDRRAPTFLTRALASAQKAGGLARRPGGRPGRSTFGRGRSASLAATRALTNRHRAAMVKARIVRHRSRGAPLQTHLTYLQRDGVTRDDQPGQMFDAGGDTADANAFAARCEDDRHHFRFIVSPDDAGALGSLRDFTRSLMAEAERDLGTKLDWVAIDHWNTEHPHIHILVRGRDDAGNDLVIARDYISRGLRGRADALVTQELGLRQDHEIAEDLGKQVQQQRWTRLDRALVAESQAFEGVVDLRPAKDIGSNDAVARSRIARLRTLERLGFAAAEGAGRWRLAPDLESRLRALGERDDIIKRMHRALAGKGWDRPPERYALAGDGDAPIVGRLAERGLHDELSGSAFAIIDGTDGRAHHIVLPDLDAGSDAAPGAIVELRTFDGRDGRRRIQLAVRSDLALSKQIAADGATWLDHRLVARDKPLLGDGFGQEVQAALDARTEHLIGQGLARREGTRVLVARGLLETLRQRELTATAGRIAAETGLVFHRSGAGETVAGIYRRRLDLASGRFAMIEAGFRFELVPWTPGLEHDRNRLVSGALSPSGFVQWRRSRGLAL